MAKNVTKQPLIPIKITLLFIFLILILDGILIYKEFSVHYIEITKMVILDIMVRYIFYFFILFILFSIIFSCVNFLIKLFLSDKETINSTKRMIWLCSWALGIFPIFFIGIMFKLEDKQKRHEEYLNHQLYKTPKNQKLYSNDRKNNYLACDKSRPTGICKDGTLTCARVRTGACSHHGGIESWY